MAAIPLNLTPAEIARVLGYFSNPKVKTFIEIQVLRKNAAKFKADYKRWTGQQLMDSDKGYSEIDPSSDKFANQLRVYFDLVGNGPQHLPSSIIKNTPSRRAHKKRISSKELVESMLKYGFLVGDNSGPNFHATIRAKNVKISPTCTQDFDNGYNDA